VRLVSELLPLAASMTAKSDDEGLTGDHRDRTSTVSQRELLPLGVTWKLNPSAEMMDTTTRSNTTREDGVHLDCMIFMVTRTMDAQHRALLLVGFKSWLVALQFAVCSKFEVH